MNWKHDALANDLAAHLRMPNRMVWTDIQLGPSGSPRPDVYTIQKSFAQPKPTAYEIKVSKSDFLSDVTSGKWQKYLQFAGTVIFAVPKGLISRNDIPATCGLMTRSESGWTTISRPRPQPINLPEKALLKLLIDGIDRIRSDEEVKPRQLNTWKAADKIRAKYGEEVARVIVDLDHARQGLQQATERKKSLNDECAAVIREAQEEARSIKDRAQKEALLHLEELRLKACKTYGLKEDASWGEVLSWRTKHLDLLTRDNVIDDLRCQLETYRRHLKRSSDLAVQRGLFESAFEEKAGVA